MENNERVKCYGCKYCKIWNDEETYTMRLSCMKTSSHGKTITWKSFPLFTKQNGMLVRTDDTVESMTKEFEDFAKRRLAPSWCEYRKTNTMPERIKEENETDYPYKYIVSYAYTGSDMANFGLGSMTLARKNKIDSRHEVDDVIKYIIENIDDVSNTRVAIINFILLNDK